VRTAVLERLRNEDFRRVRLAVVGLPQIAKLAVLGAEHARLLHSRFLHGHAIPIRIDVDTHTLIDDES
jgi:hypothetical protein